MGFGYLDVKDLKRVSIFGGKRKVSVNKFGRVFDPSDSFYNFVDSLPKILASKDLVEFSREVANRKRSGGIFIISMGAHPIKVGVSPYIIELVKRGVVDLVATNGASMVHDLEIALMGRTSEDVAEGLRDGSFGMGREISEFLNIKVAKFLEKGLGLGEALGKVLFDENPKYGERSLFLSCYRYGVPVTCHVAFGTDIFNMHPEFNPSLFGEASHRDFLKLCSYVSRLDGGAFLLVGSTVILPEVYLKAFTVSRNLGKLEGDVVTCVFDFIKHYRPMENVIKRASKKGFYIVGHHEILFPLFYGIMLKELDR